MRSRSVGAVLVCAVATGLVFSACTDSGVTSPVSRVATGQSSLGSLLGLQPAAPVHRNTPLANDITWSFTVGSGGAVSTNSAVGLTIHVPSGAVSSPTTITVTALKGTPVAYQFQPHGLQFSRKVTLTQKLQGTSAASELLSSLQGAYFPTDEPIIEDGMALVSELLNGLLNPLTKTFSFAIVHFSGYIVVSGRGSGDLE